MGGIIHKIVSSVKGERGREREKLIYKDKGFKASPLQLKGKLDKIGKIISKEFINMYMLHTLKHRAGLLFGLGVK